MVALYSTRDSLRNLKSWTADRVTEVPSAHLSEALASAFGFHTHAALLKSFEASTVAELPMPSDAAFKKRLGELGYRTVATRWAGFPNLLSRGKEPVETYRTPRRRAWRNILVAGINEALRLGLFGFGPTENFWRGATASPHEDGTHTFRYDFQFNCALPATAAITNEGHGELQFHVAINARHPEYVGPGSVPNIIGADAYAYGWLERKLGVWLQSGASGLTCRRTLLPTLAAVEITADRYSDRGKFMM